MDLGGYRYYCCCGVLFHMKRKKNPSSHFFEPRPGDTIEVRLYDEIWNMFYKERASVSDAKQMRRLISDLQSKGIDVTKI